MFLLKAALVATTAAALSLAVVPAHAASPSVATAPASAAPGDVFEDPFVPPELMATYMATVGYKYEPFASHGGYTRSDTCFADPARGGLGYHYLNQKLVGSLDPAKPAALLYQVDKESGERELGAVEWIVKNTGQPAPQLFGQTFKTDNIAGYYTLHAWIYESNPMGLFASWNPSVTCTTAATVAPTAPSAV